MRRGAAAAAALALACARTATSSGPQPIAIQPAQGTGMAPLPVEISGQRFEAAVTTDFAGGKGAVDAGFRADLVPAGGGAPVALSAVTFTPRRTLEAVVPAGISRGSYDLVVTDPRGRSGTLAQAFRVVTSAENVAGFRLDLGEPAVAGVPFLVSLTAIDAGGLTVDGFDGAVQLADLTGTATPATSGAFVLGSLSTRITVTAVTPSDRLTATDALGNTGASAAFAVSPGPPTTIAFASAPVSAAAGACSPPLTLELRDAWGNASPAPAAVDVPLQVSPPGAVTFYADGACATPVVAVVVAAGSATVDFRLVGAAAGAVAVRAFPATLPSAQQGESILP